jgi:probable rRNA maturation factor
MNSSNQTVEVDVIAESVLPEDTKSEELGNLVRHVLEREGQHGDWSVAVVLTSDQALRALHRDFMGIDAETDVMTFPSDGEPGGSARGGDIVVSVDRATVQAPEFGLSPWDEIRFLVVHGALHLCGWDDTSPVERAAMLARQRELIAEFDQGR